MTDKLQARIREMREKHVRIGVTGIGRTVEPDSALACEDGCGCGAGWPCDAIRVVKALEAALKPRGSDDRDQNTAAMIYGTGSASPEGEKVYVSAIRAIRNYRLGLEREALARAEEAMSK